MRRWGSARNGELFIIITILILRKWLGRNYFSQNTCKIYTDKGFILFNSYLGRGFDIRSSQNPGIAKISFSLIVIIWSYGHHNNNHRCAGCLIRRVLSGQSKFGEQANGGEKRSPKRSANRFILLGNRFDQVHHHQSYVLSTEYCVNKVIPPLIKL